MKRYDIEEGKMLQRPNGKYVEYDSHMQSIKYMKHRLDMMIIDVLNASTRAKIYEKRASWYEKSTWLFFIVSICLLVFNTEL
jgi:hypothetical protein